MTQKWAIVLAVLVGLSVTATPAKATVLLVGDNNKPPDPFGPVTGTVLASQTVSGTSSTLNVTVTESVVRDSVTGHLDFVYQVTNNAGSTDGVGRFTVSNFGTGPIGTTGPWTLDTGNVTTGPGVAPDTVDRLAASNGSVVGWNFTTVGIAVGNSSDILVVKTNADVFEAGQVSVIDGSAVNLAGFQPGPEPSSLAIAGLGALGLIGYGIRRRRGA